MTWADLDPPDDLTEEQADRWRTLVVWHVAGGYSLRQARELAEEEVRGG